MLLGKYTWFLLEKSVYLPILWDMYRYISLIVWFLAFCAGNIVSAWPIPFTDIRTIDPYYQAVVDLYDGGVLSDDGSGLFRPASLMDRDFYVSLAVGVGCRKCETPQAEDITKYRSSPFPDLTKSNPYYYCVAYAADIGITQGYPIDNTGRSVCEDSTSYTTVAFCENNTITRIEAVAILLRRANLWNDTLNRSISDRSLTIPDVTPYWYGYARKGIEVGLIQAEKDGKIGQDTKITRGEFALMAAKILRYTQCELRNTTNTTEGAIGVRDPIGKVLQMSSFALGSKFVFFPITSSSKKWEYTWSAINPVTGREITGKGDTLDGSTLGIGNWIISLDIRDPTTDQIVSSPRSTITISDSTRLIDRIFLDSRIDIRDAAWQTVSRDTFELGTQISFVGVTTAWEWDYAWQITNPLTNQSISGEWPIVNVADLWVGDWIIDLQISDPKSWDTLGAPQRTIRIVDTSNPGSIDIRGPGGIISSTSEIPVGSQSTLIANILTNTTTPWDRSYSWEVTNQSGKTYTGIGDQYPTDQLTAGTWYATVEVTDTRTGQIIDTLSRVIVIAGRNTWIANTFLSADIGTKDSAGAITRNNEFRSDAGFSLIPVIWWGGTWEYRWVALDITSGKSVIVSGPILESARLWVGNWVITMEVIDPETREIVATPQRSISITDPRVGPSTDNTLSVSIIANPLSSVPGSQITFSPIVSGGWPGLLYSWDYGDSTRSSVASTTSHTYTQPGTYTVTLTVTDPLSGYTAQSIIVVTVIGSSDQDNDGVSDTTDLCPNVYGLLGNQGCPSFEIGSFGTTIGSIYDGALSDKDGDSDADGTENQYDLCPTEIGIATNKWCPIGTNTAGIPTSGTNTAWSNNTPGNGSLPGNNGTNGGSNGTGIGGSNNIPKTTIPAGSIAGSSAGDKDGDSIVDAYDICPDVVGTSANSGCPQISALAGITASACVSAKIDSQWVIIGAPVCNGCPCDNRIEFGSMLRSCDIVFPTILSPDLTQIYARGKFFVVP
jgi:PKD domain/S-layer homology domain